MHYLILVGEIWYSRPRWFDGVKVISLSLSLVVWWVHHVLIHAIVRAVCPLAPKALVYAVLERRQHLLVISPDTRMVWQLIFHESSLCWWTATCVWNVRVLGIPRIISQILGLHFVFNKLRICWNVIDDFLSRLAKTSGHLQFLIGYSWRIRFLHPFTWTHLIVLILTWIVRSVALEPRVGARTVLAGTNSRLNGGWVTIDGILTTTCRASLGPSELLTTELTIVTVFSINSNLLVPLLILQCLSHKWFVIRLYDASICTRNFVLSKLTKLLVARHTRLDATVWMLTRISRVIICSLFVV